MLGIIWVDIAMCSYGDAVADSYEGGSSIGLSVGG